MDSFLTANRINKNQMISFQFISLLLAGEAPTRAYHSAVLHRNEIWIFGGVFPNPGTEPDGCSDSIEVSQNWIAAATSLCTVGAAIALSESELDECV